MLESLINKENETRKMLRGFLLQIIADSKETSETVLMFMLASPTGKAYFLASNSKGYVKNEDGKTKVFSVADVAGWLKYNAFGSAIEDYLSELIERIKKHFKLENNEVLMQTYGTDSGCNELAYFVNNKEKETVQVEFSEEEFLAKNDNIKDESKFFIFLKDDDEEEVEDQEKNEQKNI